MKRKHHNPRYDMVGRVVHFKELPDSEDTDDYMVMESSRLCADTARRNGYNYYDSCNCIDGNLGCDDCPWGNN